MKQWPHNYMVMVAKILGLRSIGFMNTISNSTYSTLCHNDNGIITISCLTNSLIFTLIVDTERPTNDLCMHGVFDL